MIVQEMKRAIQKVFMMNAFAGFFYHATGTILGESLVEASTTLLFALLHEASLSGYGSDDPTLNLRRQTPPSRTIVNIINFLIIF